MTRRKQAKTSASFLKKRSKKLLVLRALATALPQPAGPSFFATFCSQKLVLSSLCLSEPA
jgi:hypothetical protein